MVGTVALIAAGTGGEVLVTSLLDSAPLRGIGALSYSLYLWHYPALVFLAALQPNAGLTFVGEALLLATVLAVLSYRFVEQPVLRGSADRGRPSAASALVSGTADLL